MPSLRWSKVPMRRVHWRLLGLVRSPIMTAPKPGFTQDKSIQGFRQKASVKKYLLCITVHWTSFITFLDEKFNDPVRLRFFKGGERCMEPRSCLDSGLDCLISKMFINDLTKTTITGRCRYNAVNFLQNTHKEHPIMCPWGRDTGSLLWF